jgi:CheY-like chemotaxis protein
MQCDLHMPRKDGYQACKEIREWEKATNAKSEIPIIALSANVMSDVQDKCIEAGFSDYVTKPVDFISLSKAMAKFFD